jgi:hypothetical protein
VAFVAVCIVCAGVAVAAVSASGRTDVAAGGSGATTPQVPLDAVVSSPYVTFRETALGPTYGKLVVARRDAPQTRHVTDLTCDRSYAVATGGICITADRGALTTYKAVLFDRSYSPVWEQTLAGIPSRTRMSADGRYASVTTFVSGDSYAGSSFSTRTIILDVAGHSVVDDLEHFAAQRDGQPFSSTDFNYWGVTFAADSDRFYATLGTGGHTYLVQGDVAARQVTVLRDGVECPSISPDGTRLAFKKRVADDLGRVEWRESVLDLATLQDHPLAETRSVDDQAEWLDDQTVLYGLPQGDAGSASDDVWAAAADGSGPPRLLLPGAWSPAVSR